jgi:hypothetical protein
MAEGRAAVPAHPGTAMGKGEFCAAVLGGVVAGLLVHLL